MSARETNRATLLAIIARHGLGVDDVAKLCRASAWTVRAWTKSTKSRSARAITDAALELLALKLGEPSPFEVAP